MSLRDEMKKFEENKGKLVIDINRIDEDKISVNIEATNVSEKDILYTIKNLTTGIADRTGVDKKSIYNFLSELEEEDDD